MHCTAMPAPLPDNVFHASVITLVAQASSSSLFTGATRLRVLFAACAEDFDSDGCRPRVR